MNVQTPDSKFNARVRWGIFLTVLAVVTLSFFGLIQSFLLACFWAAILAIIFKGTYSWLYRNLGNRANISALLTCLIICLVVIVPIGLISFALVNESKHVYTQIESGELKPQVVIDEIQSHIPYVTHLLERVGIDSEEAQRRMNATVSTVAQAAGDLAIRYTQNAVNLVIQFTLMIYLLFFFLRDDREILNAIKSALPMGDDIEEQLFLRFAVVSRATVKGTVIVAIIQGGIGGLLFGILGIPGAVLWGVLMMLLSLLPIGGSAFVWVPAAIILFFQGETVKAIIVVLVGSLIIGLVDNLLRPLLVSRDTKMPDYLVLLAILGGIAWFGISGFIVGPVIAALFLTCWNITGRLFGGDVR